ncbi:MAG: phosphate/phosphite/phosphonate ABC transporter substrate-binding protein [Scytonematopsis contorta HA4267-MV1]|jgi:phosphonate transport system substrate-binding protein|nr:phosphate/phosphite/phosphonate ABC transporter substrate-binding protein [Scytonematopsis contorta HA4267-MV1]
MSLKISRRLFILQMLLTIAACQSHKKPIPELELVIGTVSYGEEQETLNKLSRLRDYLGQKTGSLIQVEPVFNENIAIERIKRGSWSLVFATPGLAAIAISNYKYIPILPLGIEVNSRSVLIVRKDSSLQKIKDLQGKAVALGLPGSAAGYYVPLFNLHGLTLAEILFAPTPKNVLTMVAQKKVAAGAVSLEEFNVHRNSFNNTQFRILFTDPQILPPGSVLIRPDIDVTRRQLIRDYMKDAPLALIQDLNYVPNGEIPDYKYMISVVKKVAPITKKINSKPARLF